ncbi:hypothetical protein Dda_5954 [Drechslerella dactyloides]|uniref:Uncharacterized protein n=1 Tax=Drechslerella dactyloides TaxID=74499 RepID=A0AAD6NI51_DREDA|nr:hypothetical protein Dda_5954 [Drechslerella dactyloides]
MSLSENEQDRTERILKDRTALMFVQGDVLSLSLTRNKWKLIKEAPPGSSANEAYRRIIAHRFSLTNAGSQGLWMDPNHTMACHCDEGFFIFDMDIHMARLVTRNEESVKQFLHYGQGVKYEGPWREAKVATPYDQLELVENPPY